MGVLAGFHPIQDKLHEKNGHDFQYDWDHCPKCQQSRDTVLLAASEMRPPDFCNVCIYTCSHSVRKEKRQCRTCKHVWSYMRTY
jgi:hypothetical protein